MLDLRRMMLLCDLAELGTRHCCGRTSIHHEFGGVATASGTRRRGGGDSVPA